MSTQMSVVMNAGDVPDGFVPEDVDIGIRQNILHDVDELSDLAEAAGPDRLDRFIVDHCALVDAACKANEPPPDHSPSAGRNPFADLDSDFDDHDLDEPIFFGPPGSPLNRDEEIERIEAEVERAKPWHGSSPPKVSGPCEG